VHVYLLNFVSIALFCHPVAAKNPQFLLIFELLHLMVLPVGSSLRKLNRGHHHKSSPIQRYQNCFCSPTPSWRNQVHKVWRSKAWRTDKQTKNSMFLAGWWNPNPTKLGIVMEDLEHVLAPHKLLGVWCRVSPLEALQIWGVTRPRQLKTPITP